LPPDEKLAEPAECPSSQPGPAKKPDPDAAAADIHREASGRPLEASSGVPVSSEREAAGDEGTTAEAGGEGPADSARPPAQDESAVRIIEAPEARPVSQMTPALTPSELTPVLPDEKGTVVIAEAAKIDWMDAETAGEGPGKGPAGPGEAAPAAPPAPPPVSWGERALSEPGLPAEPAPREPAGPVFPSLPSQFRGTMADIRMFVCNGTFLFFVGACVYFILAIYGLGVAAVSAFNWWTFEKAVEHAIGGLVALLLSFGSFVCMLVSRQKLEEPLYRNDLGALHRRILPAMIAGFLFGLVLGGIFFFLVNIKLEELPFVHPAPPAEVPEPAGGKA